MPEYPDNRSLFQKGLDGLMDLGSLALDGARAAGDFVSDYLLPGGAQRRANRADLARLRRENRERRKQERLRPKTGGDAPGPAAAGGGSDRPAPQTGSPPVGSRPRPSTGDPLPSSSPPPQPLVFGIEKGNQDTGPAAGTATGTGGGMDGGFA